jgi:hypothetical protein
MLSARARVFIAVSEAGGAERVSRVAALEGAVLAGRPVVVRVCSLWGSRQPRRLWGRIAIG